MSSFGIVLLKIILAFAGRRRGFMVLHRHLSHLGPWQARNADGAVLVPYRPSLCGVRGADEGQIRLFEPTPSNCFPRERAVSACASPDGGLRCGIVGGGDPQTAKRRAEPRGALARSWQSRLCWGQRAEAACGDRGGPGYRGPDGRCVGWEAPGSRLRLLVHCSNLNGNHPPCSGLGA